MTARIKTLTLGCKVNQYETQLVREGLLSAGFVDAGDSEAADLCVVNTCTVTSEGDSKGRQAIRRLHRQNPDAKIIVMGCYATRAPEEVAALPGVTEVVTDKREIPDLLGRFGVIDLPTGISGLNGRSRAYVKIQDGCLLNCTYCIIPSVRPHMYSRQPNEVLDEIRSLIDHGFREVVLTGIHLGHYGVDFNRNRPRSEWTRLATLLRDLMEFEGDFRIRLSSIEATEVTNDLIAVMRDNPDRIAPHLHVCVQSGSDRILRAMGRRWNAKRIIDRCRMVADALDRPAFTTDVIVGFPGETDDDFQRSIDLCHEIGFSKIHVFPFSRRKGTPAAEMTNQVAPEVRAARVQQLEAVDRDLRKKYFERLGDRPLKVLVESAENGNAKGTSCRYATVQFPFDEHSHVSTGEFCWVQPIEVDSERIVGRLVKPSHELVSLAVEQ
ncbi:MAG: tRNA (N(6)-L-threonylcarbamoyladenosine(37)-C(2))-methylthiotransferase MtaB [Pirellulaceae bacterium]